jgi:hypothetical protein
MKMQNMKIILFLFLFFSVSSCLIPDTKESYLRNFERFVIDVERNNSKFTRTDWKWANKRFSKYSGEWYEKFRDDLKMQDKIQVSTLRSRYLAVKEISKIGRFMNDDLDIHFEKMEDDIKNYMKKDLNKDIDEITRGAREIGDSAVKVMEDVLDQFKKTHNNKKE